MKLTKKIAVLLLVLVMAVSFCSCAKKTTFRIKPENIGEYTVMQRPTGFVSFAKQIDDIIITVKDEMDYDFVIRDNDNKEYSFTLRYQGNKGSIITNDEIKITLEIEK